MLDRKEYDRKYYIENKDSKVKYNKEHYKNNREQINKKRNEKYIDNREKELKQCKQWREDNPEFHKEYYKKNRLKINKYMRIYRKNNPEQTRVSHNQYCKGKYKTDLKFNLNEKVRIMIIHSLKGNKNGRHWEDLIRYTLADLIKRLKTTMPKGYDWNDYLEGKLHIDHKIPISAFNFTESEHTDFKRCWGLNNLQLLPARNNIIKSDKLSEPFQPALMI